ncbi:MAG: peroxide stress protein YaaA [Thermodesulfobacteriales bacterium]|nr:MAG: peroxide stress protein YaaA [Thermodesulfobacteriales bacterium]
MSEQLIKYQPSSKILIITICSFTKEAGGITYYNKVDSIINELSHYTADRLIERRNTILEHLWNGDFDTQGQTVSSHKFNSELVKGPDFGVASSLALYLPAIERYNGRFYKALGNEGKKKLVKSRHHILIQTGLYGIVKPLESIQLYSVPIEHDSLVQKTWRKNDLITEIIMEYVKRNQIEIIFDFTSRKDYRDVIDWRKIAASTQAKVFHCFSTLAAGADSLSFFGDFLNRYMLEASEEDLQRLEPDTEFEGILFRKIPETLTTLPKEPTHHAINDLPIVEEWDWYIEYDANFFRDFHNLGGTTEKSKILKDIIEIQKHPDTQIGDIQKPYSANLKGKWRRRSLKSIRLVYSFDHESRRIFIHELTHK